MSDEIFTASTHQRGVDPPPRPGKLRLCLASMGGSKSSRAIAEAKRARENGYRVHTIRPVSDTRTRLGVIESRDGSSYPATALRTINIPPAKTDGYSPPRDKSEERLDPHVRELLICDEGHMFDVNIDIVMDILIRGIDISVYALDGDKDQRMFPSIVQLVPYAYKIVKLHEICRRCTNHLPALFTIAKIETAAQITPGGFDIYEPVCIRCLYDHRHKSIVHSIENRG